MRYTLILSSLMLLFLAPLGAGGPTGGGFFKEVEIGQTPWQDKKRFRAGERAAVLVRGTNHTGPGVQVSVFDADGKIVVEVKGKNPPVPDMVAAFWYPPREADYKIEIKNLDSRVNTCYVTIK